MFQKGVNYLRERKDDELMEVLKTVLFEKYEVAARGVRIVNCYDLRSTTEVKYAACPDYSTDWIAFVNRAGTLVHVMRHGAPDLMIRLPKFKLKGTSEEYMVSAIKRRLFEGLS